MIEVKFKQLRRDACLPRYSKPGDAGMDLTATSMIYDEESDTVQYGTGLAIEIPEGYVGLLFPRSSSCNYKTIQSNCVGVIDSGYRGEIRIVHQNLGTLPEFMMGVGYKVAQLIILPYPRVSCTFVDELSSSDRGTDGFGSTGV